jgi:hypothetical protein
MPSTRPSIMPIVTMVMVAKRYSRLTTRPDSVEDLDDYMLVQWQPDAQVRDIEAVQMIVELIVGTFEGGTRCC